MIIFFERHRRLIVILLLLAKFSFGLFAMIGDAAIVDEIAHIPAGYSYMAYSDYRLNPEHPPLLKDLAGLPILALDVDFPKDHISWTTDVNGQWESGWHFLYHYGNDADQILFFARLPLLMLSILFGALIYIFTRKFFSTTSALLATFFYTLSPNFLAHSHLVTTDMGIATAIFLALASFAWFIRHPSYLTLFWATLGLAVAHITKFSSVLLIPFYFGILFILLVVQKNSPTLGHLGQNIKSIFWKKFWIYAFSYVVIMAGSILIVWIFYTLHTINFPAEKQIELINVSIPNAPDFVRNILVEMSKNKILQPLAQYILGVAMVFNRVSGGNTTFFFGQVTNQSFPLYFPASYLLKTPLAFLILLFLSILALSKDIIVSGLKDRAFKIRSLWKKLSDYLSSHITELIFFLFILYYSYISVTGNLNLGIRHLFPILPLIYILVSKKTSDILIFLTSKRTKRLGKYILALLLVWFASSTINTAPNFLSYHNEIIGGGQNAYKYFTDSNVDWGQDLKRLNTWLAKHPEVENLKLDYFGGGEPRYYLCARDYDEDGQLIKSSAGYNCENSVYQKWEVDRGPTKGWIAVSVTFLQNAQWYHKLLGQPDYDWLRDQEPYAKIGNSIFVYWVR